jgi:hypothetical protein
LGLWWLPVVVTGRDLHFSQAIGELVVEGLKHISQMYLQNNVCIDAALAQV